MLTAILITIGAVFWDYIRLYLWFENEFVKPKIKHSLTSEESDYLKGIPTVVATVNGVKIFKTDIEQVLKKLNPPNSLGVVKKKPYEYKINNILNNLIDEELLFQDAIKKQYSPSQKRIEESFFRVQSHFSSLESFEESLINMKMSKITFKNVIKRKMSIKELINKEIRSRVKIDDEEIDNYYKKNSHNLQLNKKSSDNRKNVLAIIQKEKVLNRLRKHLDSLRENSDIVLSIKKQLAKN